MAKLRELKTLMLCIFIVAVVPLIAMFYYAVNFKRYTKVGRAYVGMFHDDTGWIRHLQGKPLSGLNAPAWNNELTHQVANGLAINRDQQKQNIHRKTSNSDEANLASRNRSLCPGTSSTQGKPCVSFFRFS